MNLSALNSILEKLDLGENLNPPQKINGGPGGGHQLWKIATRRGVYCIKQLSASTNLSDSQVISRYELCESLASRFAQHGIPAICALEYAGKHLIISNSTAYLVYPWVEGYELKRDEVSRPHAIKIAKLLANIHRIDLQTSEVKQKFDTETNQSLKDAFTQVFSLNLPFSSEIEQNQAMIFSSNEIYLEAIPVLSEACVLTHGDVNQTNVIWIDETQPFLIDWEAIKKMNPTQEIIRSSLGWGISQNNNFELFLDMISTYKKMDGLFNKNHIAAALKSIFGNQIFWIMHNIRLACSTSSVDQHHKAHNEITGVLKSMKKLSGVMPDLILMLNGNK